MIFILTFTAFQTYSLDSFTNFFSGIDDRTIIFDTQKLRFDIVEELNSQQILVHHDGERIGFSGKNIKDIEDLAYVEKVEVTMANVQSLYDKDGNRFEHRMGIQEVPSFMRKDLHQLKDGKTITFPLVAQNIPYSVINHFNSENH